MTIAIVWFRRDFRLADNPALHAACAAHERLVLAYLHAPGEEGEWALGGATRWWLHQSLDALQKALGRRGASLHIAVGASLEELSKLITQTGACAVYWNRLYEPQALARDAWVESILREQGVAVHSCKGGLWAEPWQIATQEEAPYRVFTPYWRKLRTQLPNTSPLPVPSPLRTVTTTGSLPLAALSLLPSIRWDSGFEKIWKPGERGAQAMLELFADDALTDYARARDLPARHGTSRLSPHLHFGEITPLQIQHGLNALLHGRNGKHVPDLEPYLRQLGWREFAHHLLYHFPATPTENFNPRFKHFSWASPEEHVLARWQQGRTGIPLVDAGMRELWHTGWMHNRVRMVVASFLTKHLRQHWFHGERWFWDTLVDADLANNALGWQWVAGCGADAAPYFRIFNPVTQSLKFDPKGAYLRRWLPELAEGSDKLLHEPWKDPGLLKRSGYPAPIVDLGQARQEALAAYQAARG